MQNQLNKKVSMALHMVVIIVQESVFRIAKVIAEKASTFYESQVLQFKRIMKTPAK